MRRAIWLVAAVAWGCSYPPGSGGDRPVRVSDAPVVLPDDLVGCYALYDHRGRPASDSLYFAPPMVRLKADPYPVRGDSAWRLTKLDSAGRVDSDPDAHRGTQYWSAESLSDSIRIRFHTNFSGSELFVNTRAGTDTLHGHAVEHWDIGPSTNDAGPVTAIRVHCLSENA